MSLCGESLCRLLETRARLFLFLLLAPCLNSSAQTSGGADARVTISRVEQNCLQPRRIGISIKICNSGSRLIPRNTPLSFYTSDPRSAGARRFADTWLMTSAVEAGACRTFRVAVTVADPRSDSFYVVVNDNGLSRPFRLPNTGLEETSYDNNIALAIGFRFRVTVRPQKDTLERGDSVRLSVVARNGMIARFNWLSGVGLSCTDCRSPILHILKGDSPKRVIAESREGCRDTAFSTLYIRPQADYAVHIDSVVCAGDGRGNVHFTVCDNSFAGRLPDSLPVSFYQGDPAPGKQIGQPFVFRSKNSQVCAADSVLLEHLFTGNITAVVHDSLLPPAWHFPSGGHFDEDVSANNKNVFAYPVPGLQIYPADTVVVRGSTVLLRMQSDLSGIVSRKWIPGPGTSVNCDQCVTTAGVVLATAEIKAQVFTGYGCAVEARAKIHIFPPDFTGVLLESHCYQNDSLLIRFRLCMNNGYDTVPAGIPVYFSEKGKGGGRSIPPAPVFYTPAFRPGGCAEYQLIIAGPTDSLVTMEVNAAGDLPPGQISLLDETNQNNNRSSLVTVPFRVRVPFADTVVNRGSELQLSPVVSGDEAKWFRWQPALFLDCARCLFTRTSPDYDITYHLRVSSTLGCDDSAQIRVRTIAGSGVNIPNAFSPDGNGHNDVFYVTGRKELRVIKHMSVFNRSGQIVMERNGVPPNDPAYGWDGNYHGSKAPGGGYIYVVTVEFSDGREESHKGTVMLLR